MGLRGRLPLPARLGYVPALDGVRGIAITLVVSLHYFRWPLGGVLGVDLFFVLSGFLITTLLLEEWDERGSISLRGFYGRRARRLFPALAALVLLAAALAIAVHPDQAGRAIETAVIRLSYVTNILAAAGYNLGNFGHLWSLGAEEQFYLLWPPVLILLLARRVGSGWMLMLLLVCVAAVALRRFELAHASWERIWYGPDSHSDPILIGCGAAIVRFRWALRVSRMAATMAASSMLVLAIWYRVSMSAGPRSLFIPTFAVASAVMVLGALQPSRLSRALAVRPLVRLGEISYSLYVWHYPPLFFFGAVPLRGIGLPLRGIGLALSLAAALLSYQFIEKPFRRRRVTPLGDAVLSA